MTKPPTDSLVFRRDMGSGVPAYRQIIDQVLGAIACGTLSPGEQLPTVRQLAVELAINPNTVVRAYRELELRGVLDTQQGVGTFVTRQVVPLSDSERQRRVSQLAADFLRRVGEAGLPVQEVIERIQEFSQQGGRA